MRVGGDVGRGPTSRHEGSMKDIIVHVITKAWSRSIKEGRQPNWPEIIRNALEQFRQDRISLEQCSYRKHKPPLERCKYLPSKVAFLRFVLWAELVWVMNSMKAAYERDDSARGAPFPSLAPLHGMLQKAKELCLREKSTWTRNIDGDLDCEDVEGDVDQMCMRSMPRRQY